jgi:tetratricopeptide (TPR) repeat protein
MVLALGGCAAQSAPQSRQPATGPAAATDPAPARPDDVTDSKAKLTLDEIEPLPKLPHAAEETKPSEPPLEAIRLFAKARIAMLDGQRLDASRLLEQAISLDAESFELHKALGDLYAAASDARAGEEWEKAAAIEPDHLDLQIDLGRRAVDDGDAAKGIEHLRLGLLTADYRRDDPAAGEDDFVLARTLQQQGYDRAALQMYERLLARLRAAHFATRMNPQMAALLSRPDLLALHVAALYEKNKSYAPALSLLRAVGAHVPGDFELQARIIRDEASAGEPDLASRDATELVARFHADARSVSLLAEVAGDGAIGMLGKLHEADPRDRDVAYALADVLVGRNRATDASNVLADAAARWPEDPRLIRRQMDLRRITGDLKGAAGLAIAAFARRPDHEIELSPLWDSLAQASPHGRLHVADVESISVPAASEPARLVLLARLAEVEHRDGVEREALTRAVGLRPAFAPAFREMLALIWSDDGRTQQQKIDAARDLSNEASNAGDAGLAAELRGQALLDLGEAQPAATEFAAAVKAGNRAAELTMNFAAALHGIGDDQGAQSLLWKVISDRPLATDAYEELYAIYQKREEPERAKGVMTVWLSADPDSIAAQQLQAREAFGQRRFTDAEHILLELLGRHDADPRVLGAVEQFYSETGRLKDLIPILQQRLAAERWNSSLALALSEAYEGLHQRDEALHVLDALREAIASDANALYSLAGAYSRMAASDRSEQVLAQVLKLDPSFAGANNDLGYTWAEQGKNLLQAEAMVARALRAEPDNPSFLDSMGWVLYKRGKFQEAVKDLARAAVGAEPVVLDHLGDALYRLGDHDKAAAQWKQAAAKIGEAREDERDDLKELRRSLEKKQEQVAAGKTVNVATVGEEK